MTAELSADARPRLPRLVTAISVGAIALGSLVALVWPLLPFADGTFSGQTRVGIVTRTIDSPDAAGIVGRPAPDFEWVTATGSTTKLSDLRGGPVVVNYWATWCLPCRQEMPALERAARADDRTRFIAVDLDEDGGRIRSFFDQLALERLQPVLDRGAQTARRFGVVSLPTTFFIGADGVVRHVEIGGPMSEDTIRRGLEAAR